MFLLSRSTDIGENHAGSKIVFFNKLIANYCIFNASDLFDRPVVNAEDGADLKSLLDK